MNIQGHCSHFIQSPWKEYSSHRQAAIAGLVIAVLVGKTLYDLAHLPTVEEPFCRKNVVVLELDDSGQRYAKFLSKKTAKVVENMAKEGQASHLNLGGIEGAEEISWDNVQISTMTQEEKKYYTQIFLEASARFQEEGDEKLRSLKGRVFAPSAKAAKAFCSQSAPFRR